VELVELVLAGLVVVVTVVVVVLPFGFDELGLSQISNVGSHEFE